MVEYLWRKVLTIVPQLHVRERVTWISQSTLISTGADIRIAEDEGSTPLHWASEDKVTAF